MMSLRPDPLAERLPLRSEIPTLRMPHTLRIP